MKPKPEIPGRVPGLRVGRTIEAVAKKREAIIGAQLAAALGGDAAAARLCLELIGELPVRHGREV